MYPDTPEGMYHEIRSEVHYSRIQVIPCIDYTHGLSAVNMFKLGVQQKTKTRHYNEKYIRWWVLYELHLSFTKIAKQYNCSGTFVAYQVHYVTEYVTNRLRTILHRRASHVPVALIKEHYDRILQEANDYFASANQVGD